VRPASARSVVIVRHDNLGDVALALPMAGLLKRARPGRTVIFAVRRYARDVALASRHVDEVIEVTDAAAFERDLRARRPDAIVFAFPSEPLARAAARAGVPLRAGTAARWFHWRWCNLRPLVRRSGSALHEAQLNLRLLAPFVPDADVPLAAVWPLAGLAPAAGDAVADARRASGASSSGAAAAMPGMPVGSGTSPRPEVPEAPADPEGAPVDGAQGVPGARAAQGAQGAQGAPGAPGPQGARPSHGAFAPDEPASSAAGPVPWPLRPGVANVLLQLRSNGNGKEWPVRHYLSLVASLPADRYHFVVNGTPAEGEALRALAPSLFAMPQVTDATSGFPVAALMRTLRRADAVLSSSTGPLHLAALSGAPTVGLFVDLPGMGPERWGPLGPRAIAIRAPRDACVRCPRGAPECPCMAAIEVGEVARALREAVGER
jgi:ADP-heptose:LPS heptosyltransferase